eukprot:717120_1
MNWNLLKKKKAILTTTDIMGCLFSNGTFSNTVTVELRSDVETVISIDDLLSDPYYRPEEASMNLKKCLEARGWVKIKLPDTIIHERVHRTMGKIKMWLDQTEHNEKLKFSAKLNNGEPNPQSEYSFNAIAGYKEGLRVLTGDMFRLHEQENKYSEDISDELMGINNILDGMSFEILKKVYNTIYGLSDYTEFGTKYDISLLNDKLKFSMLDFVKYYNDKQFIEKIRSSTDDNKLQPNVLKTDFNVCEHIDPGLFAISFGSTNEGLELYDPVSDEWIKIKPHEAVWWNGDMSTKINSDLKAGKHRVMINDDYVPRFTGWYEVSCNKQLNQNIMQQALQSIQQTDEFTPLVLRKTDDDVFLKEYMIGIPMSKNLI